MPKAKEKQEESNWPPEEVRALRAATGLTQEEFSRIAGVTFSTINRWENGHAAPSRLASKGLDEIKKNPNLYKKSA